MFYVVKAQGELKFPDMDWSIARFEQECSNLRDYQNKIFGIHEDVAQAKAKIRDAIKQLSFPNQAPSEPERPNQELPQLPIDRTQETTTANPGTNAQTPPSQRE